MIERVVAGDGRVVERRVEADHRRPLRAVQVVSTNPYIVDVDGREVRLFKRLRSLDVSQVTVGSWLLVCRVEQGLIAVGEVI